MRRKGNLSVFLGKFLEACFGKQKGSLVLGKSTSHVMFENIHERVDFYAKS
jgi:hypothetical protein